MGGTQGLLCVAVDAVRISDAGGLSPTQNAYDTVPAQGWGALTPVRGDEVGAAPLAGVSRRIVLGRVGAQCGPYEPPVVVDAAGGVACPAAVVGGELDGLAVRDLTDRGGGLLGTCPAQPIASSGAGPHFFGLPQRTTSIERLANQWQGPQQGPDDPQLRLIVRIC